MDYIVKHMGQHRGNARLWFETGKLAEYGFERGKRYDVTLEANESGSFLHLKLADSGKRIVSGKTKGEKTIPIIDINDNAVLGKLADEPAVKVTMKKGHIFVQKLSSAEKAAARKNNLIRSLAAKTLAVAALCFGGGMMDHAAHAGMIEAGVQPELVAAVEINEDLINHAAQHNPAVTAKTRLYAAPMQELVQDDAAMNELPKVDVLVTGIPCSGASVSGRSKNGIACAEQHPEVGHLVVPYIMLVNKFNPSVAVVECVVPYASTVSAMLMRQMFRDMGYDTHEVVLNSWDFGSIEERKRWFLVAVTHGIPMNLEGLEPTIKRRPKLGDFLVTDFEAGGYRTMDGLRDKEERDREAGKGFRMQIVNGDAIKIGTIGKDYNKNRSTEPKVQHSSDPTMLRLLTPVEHARIKGYPVELLGDLSVTAGHQMLGQGVDARPVQCLFKRITENLKAWDQTQHQTRVAYSLGRATG
jgi:DNA (cytosine-5)-methyltransferase 1